jgi:hypothetical protein
MTRKKLNKVWQAIDAYRRNLPKLSDLEALARLCGRAPYSGSKHVMWMSAAFPHHRAFPIPRHGRDPVASYGVRNTVLEHMEADAVAWEEVIEQGNGVRVNGDGNGTD